MTNENSGSMAPISHPSLEMAAKEIEAVLKNWNIAGVAVIHTIGFKKVINILNPDYSVIEVDDQRRLKVNRPIVDPQNPEAADKKIADTVNMLSHMQVTTAQVAQVLGQALVAVKISFGLMPAPKNASLPPNKFINGKKRK